MTKADRNDDRYNDSHQEGTAVDEETLDDLQIGDAHESILEALQLVMFILEVQYIHLGIIDRQVMMMMMMMIVMMIFTMMMMMMMTMFTMMMMFDYDCYDVDDDDK